MRLFVSVDRWSTKLLTALALLPLSGCGTSSAICENPTPQGALVTCEAGFSHREEVLACVASPPSPECSVGPSDECKVDADCTARPNGRCGVVGDPDFEEWCGCSYKCQSDADCNAGDVCLCPGGTCMTAKCKTDADCGDGNLCVVFSQECGDPVLYCQSGADECTTDAECSGSNICDYDGTRRFCTAFYDPCEGVGRPFLVAGSARLAVAAPRGDWNAGGLSPSVDGLDPNDRRALAAHWTQMALMEHASIAAFARFVLQLLSLGAPPDLVRDAQAAMADETRHAEICFAFASAYAGAPVGPGPLAIDRAMESIDARTILITTIQEGCVGETVAAIEAAESAARAEDPVIRAALLRIAEDETRHAELAYRFVQWALAAIPDLAGVAQSTFAAALSSNLATLRALVANEHHRKWFEERMVDFRVAA